MNKPDIILSKPVGKYRRLLVPGIWWLRDNEPLYLTQPFYAVRVHDLGEMFRRLPHIRYSLQILVPSFGELTWINVSREDIVEFDGELPSNGYSLMGCDQPVLN